jgi:hypothetical protein
MTDYTSVLKTPHSVEKPESNMNAFDKAIVKIILALICMVTIMFALGIGLEYYKVSQGITKQCQCSK